MSKKASSKNTEKKDQYTVVLENLRSDFKVFDEALMGMNKKMDAGFKRIDERLDNHDKKFIKIANRFDDIDDRFDSHSEMLAKIMVDVTEIKGDLKQKVDRKEFAGLERRTLRLERGV